MAETERFKIGVAKGAGPAPGYQWSVAIIDLVYEEAVPLLTEVGYAHMSLQMRELAKQEDPTRSDLIDVQAVDDFYEIRDHGSPFGGRNVRLFFGTDKGNRVLIPLGVIVKQNNGPTPLGDKIRMGRRWRNYRRGDYGALP